MDVENIITYRRPNVKEQLIIGNDKGSARKIVLQEIQNTQHKFKNGKVSESSLISTSKNLAIFEPVMKQDLEESEHDSPVDDLYFDGDNFEDKYFDILPEKLHLNEKTLKKLMGFIDISDSSYKEFQEIYEFVGLGPEPEESLDFAFSLRDDFMLEEVSFPDDGNEEYY